MGVRKVNPADMMESNLDIDRDLVETDIDQEPTESFLTLQSVEDEWAF